MNNVDKQYLDLLNDIIENGTYKETRSGGVYSVFGRQMRFNLKEGLPILTTKKVFVKGIIHELLWFLSGNTNIKYLVDNNVHIWDDDSYRHFLNITKDLYKDALYPRIITKEEFIEGVKEEYEIKNKIEYLGDLNTDLNNLRISNQGGTIIIRAVNQTGKQYTSNEKILEHNGKLLEKAQIYYEEVKATIKFDLVISLESDISFRSTIELEFPTGNIIEEGSSSTEIKNMKDIIFKRD
mgnify:CR=1 FL=1